MRCGCARCAAFSLSEWDGMYLWDRVRADVRLGGGISTEIESGSFRMFVLTLIRA